MSIYSTWLSLDDTEHNDGCAIYEEVEPGLFKFSGDPCDCGTPRAPIVYEGSHVLPGPESRRGGGIDVAAIPAFIEREGREQGPHDWLRLSVDEATVVLDRPLVVELRDVLEAWLDREESVDE